MDGARIGKVNGDGGRGGCVRLNCVLLLTLVYRRRADYSLIGEAFDGDRRRWRCVAYNYNELKGRLANLANSPTWCI